MIKSPKNQISHREYLAKLEMSKVRLIYNLGDSAQKILENTIQEQLKERNSLLKNGAITESEKRELLGYNPKRSINDMIQLDRLFNIYNMELLKSSLSEYETHPQADISLQYLGLTRIPEALVDKLLTYEILTDIRLGVNEISRLPESFMRLTRLTVLGLNNNRLDVLPDSFGRLEKLERLYLENNQLKSLPNSFCRLKELCALGLTHNRLKTFPALITHCTALKLLFLSNNQIDTLPEAVKNLTLLAFFYLDFNQLKTLPSCLKELPLVELGLNGNIFTLLPPALSGLLQSTENQRYLSLTSPKLPPKPIIFSKRDSKTLEVSFADVSLQKNKICPRSIFVVS